MVKPCIHDYGTMSILEAIFKDGDSVEDDDPIKQKLWLCCKKCHNNKTVWR